MSFVSMYGEKTKVVSSFNKPTRTKPSFQAECDINNILKKYAKTGLLPDLIKQNPAYGDFSEPMDYQDAMNTVIFAEKQFQSLSADIRKKFNNNPQEFLSFATDESNIEEMRKMGLAKPKDFLNEASNVVVENAEKATKEV